jgi:hypothetical protein
MKKESLRNGLRFLAILCIAIILYACANVLSRAPLPVGEGETLKEVPKALLGDYKKTASSPSITEWWSPNGPNQKRKSGPGIEILRFSYADTNHLFMETFLRFTKEDLKPDSIAKYYTLRGNYLLYCNDSLVSAYNKLQTKNVKISPERRSPEDVVQLNDFESKEQTGELRKIFHVTSQNGELTYRNQPFAEIDFKNGGIILYSKDGILAPLKLILTHYKNHYCFNTQPSQDKDTSLWVNHFLFCRHDSLILAGFNPEILKRNARYYHAITGMDTSESGNDVYINPTANELNNLLAEDTTLTKALVYVKAESGVPKKNYRLLLIVLITLIAFALAYFIKRK